MLPPIQPQIKVIPPEIKGILEWRVPWEAQAKAAHTQCRIQRADGGGGRMLESSFIRPRKFIPLTF